MMPTHTWQVSIQLAEDGDRTEATAVLRTDEGSELRHEAVARRNPSDREVPEIGEELAASRALFGLAQDLLEQSVVDVARNVGRPVSLDH